MNEAIENQVNETMRPCEILEMDDAIETNEWESLLESLQVSIKRKYC